MGNHVRQNPTRRICRDPGTPGSISAPQEMIMHGNIEGSGNARQQLGSRIMGLPRDFGIEVIPVGVKVPASNADDGVFVVAIDDLHVPDGRIANEASSLFVEVEGQSGFRFFFRLYWAADGDREPGQVLAWRVSGRMRRQFIKVLELYRAKLKMHSEGEREFFEK
ncbi:hypothetical protein BP5796_12113 [Coleophoma crateriformis]|uniref:Uncharacterized protein n=1 Tax=Coleophoma crateriformis TaxID=565419 RepID=A0A3D8QBN4_9HELO|nr:hypothetical protein BP5796_12113 [Coleophoma crateriformis]